MFKKIQKLSMRKKYTDFVSAKYSQQNNNCDKLHKKNKYVHTLSGLCQITT